MAMVSIATTPAVRCPIGSARVKEKTASSALWQQYLVRAGEGSILLFACARRRD